MPSSSDVITCKSKSQNPSVFTSHAIISLTLDMSGKGFTIISKLTMVKHPVVSLVTLTYIVCSPSSIFV